MKKKLAISLLIAVMALVMAACSEKEADTPAKPEKEVQKKDENDKKHEGKEEDKRQEEVGKEDEPKAPHKEEGKNDSVAKVQVERNKQTTVKPGAYVKDIEIAKKYAENKGLVKGLKVKYEFSHSESGYNIIRVFEQLDNRQHVVAWLAVNAKTKKVYDTTTHPLAVVVEKEVNNYKGVDYTGYKTEDKALYKDLLIAQEYAKSKGLVKGIKVTYEFTQSEGNFSIIRAFEQTENRENTVVRLAVNKTTKKVYDVTTKPLSQQIK